MNASLPYRRLENYAYLVKKYCLAETGRPPADDPHSAALQALQDSISLSEINSRHPVSVRDNIQHMLHGLEMPLQLWRLQPKRRPPCTSLPLEPAPGMQEAEVLCMLYARLGTTMLPKLRGEFAFVIFDSRTVRLCAALRRVVCLCVHQTEPVTLG